MQSAVLKTKQKGTKGNRLYSPIPFPTHPAVQPFPQHTSGSPGAAHLQIQSTDTFGWVPSIPSAIYLNWTQQRIDGLSDRKRFNASSTGTDLLNVICDFPLLSSVLGLGKRGEWCVRNKGGVHGKQHCRIILGEKSCIHNHKGLITKCNNKHCYNQCKSSHSKSWHLELLGFLRRACATHKPLCFPVRC